MGMIISGALIIAAIGFMIAFAMDVYFKKTAFILALVCGIASLIVLFLFYGRHTL